MDTDTIDIKEERKSIAKLVRTFKDTSKDYGGIDKNTLFDYIVRAIKKLDDRLDILEQKL